jgi:hypothetical protein
MKCSVGRQTFNLGGIGNRRGDKYYFILFVDLLANTVNIRLFSIHLLLSN